MNELVSLPFSTWESFYVIVGSSAAALTGLQFVVIALVAEARRASTTKEIDAFGTPNVVHFCAVLMVSATLSAPWTDLAGAAAVLAVAGLAGVIYIGLVLHRARRQTGYEPVLEDWLFHVIFPFVAYLCLAVAPLTMYRDATDSLFCIGAAALLLLFVGIHNAWDTVTWIVVNRVGNAGTDKELSS
jgi:hypothetical protein